MKRLLLSQLEEWTDFSSSAVKPLLWMLIGPMLILGSLLVAIPLRYDLLLPCVSTVGLAVIWKWRLNGLSCLLVAFAFYFGAQTLFAVDGIALWQMAWGASLALALVISYFTMEEVRAHYSIQREESEKAVSDLKFLLHNHQEKGASEKRLIENEYEKLQERLEEAQLEITSLFQLVDASRVESEQTFKRNEMLASESLEQYREIEALKLKLEESLEGQEELRLESAALNDKHNKQLKELNEVRTERAQFKMFFETAQEDFKKFRKVIMSQREQIQEKPIEKKGQYLVLETLEKDKMMIKKAYDQVLVDHNKLQELLGKAQEEDAQTLQAELKEKKRVLDQTKSELTDLEREIFAVKKGMQQQGLAT